MADPSKQINLRRYERPGLTVDEVEEIKEAFDLFDIDGSGLVDPKELKAAILSLGFEARNQTIYQMLLDLDQHTSRPIDFEEFVDLMTARLSDRCTRDDCAKVFRLFDTEQKGSINVSNLRRIAKELGEAISAEELQEMILRADSNGDGEVTLNDFYHVMARRSL